MSLWNKILVWLIGVAALPMLFLAMWTLKTHKYWAELAQRHERRIEQLGDESQRLAEGLQKEGELVEPGIRQVNLELYKLLLDRRRAWFHCDPKLIKVGDNGTAEITLSIEQPVPHGIADKNKKAVVYAFEEADVQKKGQYLGEFAASGVDNKRVLLTPTAKLTTREINRLKKLAKTKGPWVLYEMLPRDNHELFAGLGDEQLKALLPAGVLPEYLKDGKPAAPDDPKERVQGGKYVRQLRDYGVLLGADQEKRILLSDSIEAAANDKQLLDEALADARKQEEGCKKDIREGHERPEEVGRPARRGGRLSQATRGQVGRHPGAGGPIDRNQPGHGRPDGQVPIAGRRADRRPHPCHGAVRCGEALTGWASTIASITGRSNGLIRFPTFPGPSSAG